eukprot:1141205-Pelagomonas_calceolata.AAC.4
MMNRALWIEILAIFLCYLRRLHGCLPGSARLHKQNNTHLKGAVQPSTSPGDRGLQPGTDREGKEGAKADRAAWMAEENWMVPASTCGKKEHGRPHAGHSCPQSIPCLPRKGPSSQSNKPADLRNLSYGKGYVNPLLS